MPQLSLLAVADAIKTKITALVWYKKKPKMNRLFCNVMIG
jgi:hypothetical protein